MKARRERGPLYEGDVEPAKHFYHDMAHSAGLIVGFLGSQ